MDMVIWDREFMEILTSADTDIITVVTDTDAVKRFLAGRLGNYSQPASFFISKL